ncbi:hypothetical protein U3516DRAFT_612488 [Neocallimastix sp. 'constans']|jgi:hypothetical protein
MQFFKKSVVFTIASLLLLSSKVNAENDCENLEKALKYFNDDVKKAFNIQKCCDFNGVRCDADKNIIELKFNNLNKTKDISSFIDNVAKLKKLNYLDLANDNIESSIPKSLCSITSLKNLNLSKNKFKGTIPYECKDLQNLEQVNFEGNKDLTGYIPVLSNVKGCAYKNTGLCDVQNALCKNAPKTCTEEDIKNTNAKNGNPDSKSTTYEGSETRNRDLTVYDNSNGYSYGYTGYDGYSNYGSYDTNNYYGSNGYGYGYGDWGYTNGYDNSYYDSGYYGTGYDNGYYGTGYDTSYYDNGSYGYNYDGGYPVSQGTGNFFTSVIGIIMYCVIFGLIIFACCICYCCGCCGSSRGVRGANTREVKEDSNVKETAEKV